MGKKIGGKLVHLNSTNGFVKFVDLAKLKIYKKAFEKLLIEELLIDRDLNPLQTSWKGRYLVG